MVTNVCALTGGVGVSLVEVLVRVQLEHQEGDVHREQYEAHESGVMCVLGDVCVCYVMCVCGR
jgi:hypothetical protein